MYKISPLIIKVNGVTVPQTNSGNGTYIVRVKFDNDGSYPNRVEFFSKIDLFKKIIKNRKV